MAADDKSTSSSSLQDWSTEPPLSPASPSHLTHFKPLTPDQEEPPLRSAYSSLVSLFRFSKDDGRPSSSTTEKSASAAASPQGERRNWSSPSLSAPHSSTTHRKHSDLVRRTSTASEGQRKSETPLGSHDPRTAVQLRTALKRLKEIMEGKSQDSDLKQYWMPDSQCKECYDCNEKFTTFRRRHHCRLCGQIFCSRCCNQEIPGKFMGYTGDLRACTYCRKIALSYAHSADSGSIGEDLTALSDSPCSVCLLEPNEPRTPVGGRKASRNIFLEEDITWQRETGTIMLLMLYKFHSFIDSSQLKDLWKKICHSNTGMEFQDHRYWLRTYPNCIVGKELVNWLLRNGTISTRAQAIAIGQALVDGRWLDCVTHHDQIFRDEYALYRPLQSTEFSETPSPDSDSVNSLEGHSEPSWFKDIKFDDSDTEQLADDNDYITPNSASPSKRTSVSSFQSAVDSDSAASINLNMEQDNVNYHIKKQPKYPHVPPHPAEQKTEFLVTEDGGQHISISDAFIKESLFNRRVEEKPKEMLFTPLGWHHSSLDQLREENGEKKAMERLLSANHSHMMALLQQLLYSESLSLSWRDIIVPVVRQVVQTVRPDVRSCDDDMDIRQLVHIKKIPGGKKFDSVVVNGFVCTKNIAHKKMNSYIKNPKILLLKCSIEYLYREETKFTCIDPIVLQEREFLKNYVQRIVDVRPNLVLVEKTVSRIAQDMLLEHGITLVINVKPQVLDRVSRMTQGDLVMSMDQLLTKPRLGTCHKFYLHSFQLPNNELKTLMFFEGCPPQLGCTIKLRGASEYELSRVKEIITMMVCVAYHSQLEISFLMDEFAMPPSLSKSTSFPCLLESAAGEEENEAERDLQGTGSGLGEDRGRFLSDTDIEPGLQNIMKSHSRQTSISESSLKDGESPKVSRSDPCASPLGGVTEEIKTSTPVSCSTNQPPPVSPPYLISDLEEIAEEEVKEPLHAEENGDDEGTMQEESAGSEISLPPARLFRDPLQDDTGLFVAEQVTSADDHLKSISACFKQELKDIILCISPFVTFCEPFLLTPAGLRCPSRDYFPENVYLSPLLNKEFKELDGRRKKLLLKETAPPTGSLTNGMASQQRHTQVLPSHMLTTACIVEPLACSNDLARMLADYRAQGGRIRQRDVDPFASPPPTKAPVKADSEEEKGPGQSEMAWATKVSCSHLATLQYILVKAALLVFIFFYRKILSGNSFSHMLLLVFHIFLKHTDNVDLRTTINYFNITKNNHYHKVCLSFRLQDLFQLEKGRKRMSVPPSPGRPHRQTISDDSKTSVLESSPRNPSPVVQNGEKEDRHLNTLPSGSGSSSLLQLPSPAEQGSEPLTPGPSFPDQDSISIPEDVFDGHLLGSNDSQVKEKTTMKTILANLLPGNSYNPIPLPFDPDKHYLMYEHERVPIAVCEREPSSIIAFALSCKEYKNALEELSKTTLKASGEDSSQTISSGESRVRNSPAKAGEVSTSQLGRGSVDADPLKEPETGDKQKKQSGNPHIELQFSDASAKFYCRIYYAEEFHKMREEVMESTEEDFVRSLSHCVNWQARGGKSGAVFYATEDDRFILKQMPRLEVQSFLDFAPNYFTYITGAVQQKRPTALAKILGVYRIGYKNSQNNTEKKLDLLVMENLFYGRKMAQVFDLKGSLRNRNVKTDQGKESCEVVLLDENLLKLVHDNPLYIRSHCKAILRAAIHSDAYFLSSHLIIDYSLLVGRDDSTDQLVVGIIDYIRTFTWDKKLEMVVKSTGILGGQGKMPTVVSPELYRARFCEAMDKYFLMVPDHWTALGVNC
uniref:1-phosphatidylinositol 3-phosphate 5-kinase n=1 Tax=Astyanax mexicanus TaxID=7994 RepID=A0A8B9J9L1_ASTMX